MLFWFDVCLTAVVQHEVERWECTGSKTSIDFVPYDGLITWKSAVFRGMCTAEHTVYDSL